MSIRVIFAAIILVVIVLVYYLVRKRKTFADNTTYHDVTKTLADAKNSAKTLYDAIQAVYTRLRIDEINSSDYLAFMQVYTNGYITGSLGAFITKADSAIATIKEINSKIALPGCKPLISSTCGYYTMLMSLTPSSSPAMIRSIISESKNLPGYLKPLKKLIIDCNNAYIGLQNDVKNESPNNYEGTGTSTYMGMFGPGYYAAISYLATNLDTLVNNAVQSGQNLANML